MNYNMKFFEWWRSLTVEEIDRMEKMAAVDVAATAWHAAVKSIESKPTEESDFTP